MLARIVIITIMLRVMPFGVHGVGIYERSHDFGPVRLSFQDLENLLGKFRTSALFPTNTSDTITLDDGHSKHRLPASEFKASSFRTFPVAYETGYTLIQRSGALTEIFLSLDDSRRRLSVAGESEVAVNSTFLIISDELRKHQTLFGGSDRRFGAIMILCIAVGPLSGLLQSKGFKSARPLVAIPVAALIVNFAMGPNLFPGAPVFSGEASWVIRNNPMVGLVSLIVGTLLSVIGIWLSLRSRPQPTRQRRKAGEKPSAAKMDTTP
jgi:hypothetical protein